MYRTPYESRLYFILLACYTLVIVTLRRRSIALGTARVFLIDWTHVTTLYSQPSSRFSLLKRCLLLLPSAVHNPNDIISNLQVGYTKRGMWLFDSWDSLMQKFFMTWRDLRHRKDHLRSSKHRTYSFSKALFPRRFSVLTAQPCALQHSWTFSLLTNAILWNPDLLWLRENLRYLQSAGSYLSYMIDFGNQSNLRLLCCVHDNVVDPQIVRSATRIPHFERYWKRKKIHSLHWRNIYLKLLKHNLDSILMRSILVTPDVSLTIEIRFSHTVKLISKSSKLTSADK